MWTVMEKGLEEIINETNFPHDGSAEAAKNYCRNPSMDNNGPWCFARINGSYTADQCDVCQDLGKVNTIMSSTYLL